METTAKKENALSKIGAFFMRYPSILATIAIFIISSIATKNFLSMNNVMNVLRQISMYGICAAGLAFIVISGGIDISISATVGLTNILLCKLGVDMGWNPWLAALICLITALATGALNGYFIAVIGAPPLIATYALQSTIRGVILIITDAYPIYAIPDGVEWFSRGMVGPVPVPVILMVITFLICWFILTYTKFGRRVYATGGNIDAAHLSGIKVIKVRIASFMIAHTAAWFAGIIATARLNMGATNTGTGWEFEALSSCIIGGISLAGGQGNVWGAMFGAIFVGILINLMTLLNVNSYWQQILKGVVLLAAIIADIMINAHNAKKKG